MGETSPENRKTNWVGLVVTTVLGIGATLAVGWYQLAQAEKQSILAEEERARVVRQGVVSIVEEHVLNDKAIDLPRLARLIDQRRREERVSTPITIGEVLESAEFNTLGSRYLAFEKKQAVKLVFDKLYSDLNTRSFAQYSANVANADLLNSLARQIQDGKSREALQSLKRLQEAHAKDLQQARSEDRRTLRLTDDLAELVRNPLPLVLTLVVYIMLLYWVFSHRSEVYGMIRRLTGSSIAPAEARERIGEYREFGMTDEMIVDRITRLGVPRASILMELERLDEERMAFRSSDLSDTDETRPASDGRNAG